MTKHRRKFDVEQDEESPIVTASVDLDSAGQDQTELEDRLEEWIREVQSFSTTPAVQLRTGTTSYAELGARPKTTSDPRPPPMTVDDRDKKSMPLPPVTMERPRQEVWDHLGDMNHMRRAPHMALDAITKVKKGWGCE